MTFAHTALRPASRASAAAIVFGTILLSLAAPAAAQRPGKAARASRIAGPAPRIDGALDDPAWRAATPIEDFVEKLPDEGSEPKVRTEIRILYDDDAVYLGARLRRPDPENIPVPVTRRDASSNAEQLVVSFDTYLDRRTAYSFSISSGGVRGDYYHGQDSQSDRQYEYDPIWHAKARVDSLGWTAEMRIPFSQLRFGAKNRPWGLQIQRLIPDRNMDLYWVLIPRAQDQSGWSSFFGELDGIADIETSRGVEVVPFVAGELTAEGNRDPRDPFDRSFAGRAGADLKVGLGNLTLDATVNPDFGQVEADPAEVNLTAFETVFEEKRPFFIEGNEILTGRAQSFLGRPTYFYTRRIGAAPHADVDGDFVDAPRNTTILGAGKVTGRLPSRLSVGLLAAVTAREHGRGYDSLSGVTTRLPVEPTTGYGVLRLQQEVGSQQSTLGMVFTSVHRGVGEPGGLERLLARDALTGGVDWRLRFEQGKYELTGWAGFSRVSGEAEAIDRVQRASAHYYQRPDADYLDYDPLRTSLGGYTASVRADKNAGKLTLWGIQVGVKSPGFEINDIGQLGRADVVDFNADLQLQDTKPNRVLRYLRVGHAVVGQWDFGGERQAMRFSHSTTAVFRNYWTAAVRAQYSRAALSNTLTRGGPYMATPESWQLVGSLSGNQSARTTWSVQGSYLDDRLGGSRLAMNLRVTTRPSARWEASLAPAYVRSTTARQFVGRASGGGAATFGARYLFAFVDQRTISTQFRLNYAFTPNLTIQAYAEPFASSGRFYDFGELVAARTSELRTYGVAAGTTITEANGVYTVTDGEQSFSIAAPDFRFLSFRSNLVLRWEWLPGSTLFAIWQQDRSEDVFGEHEIGARSLWDAFRARGNNFFALKMSYWLKAR